MDIATVDIPSDELRLLIATAQSDLTLAAKDPTMNREPFRFILAGLTGTLSVFGKSISRWERAVADVVAARDPLPEADRTALKTELIAAVEDGAYRGTRKEAQRMIRTLDRRLAVMIGIAIGGAFILGIVVCIGFFAITGVGPYSRDSRSAAAWHDLMQYNPDPRPALATTEVKTDRSGRRYYSGLSLWIDPARPPSGQ
jgi:hypothetical protein